MLVFILNLSVSTLKWVPICQGFSHFLGFLHHFVMAKLVTSSIRVKSIVWMSDSFGNIWGIKTEINMYFEHKGFSWLWVYRFWLAVLPFKAFCCWQDIVQPMRTFSTSNSIQAVSCLNKQNTIIYITFIFTIQVKIDGSKRARYFDGPVTSSERNGLVTTGPLRARYEPVTGPLWQARKIMGPLQVSKPWNVDILRGRRLGL